jgi:hypothetical protein
VNLEDGVRRVGVAAGVLVLALTLLAVVPGGAGAQGTRADSAAVILDAASRFRAEGRADVASALFEYLLERFGDTAAAQEARRQLASGAGERAVVRSGRVELQVWSTLYGLWLGVAVPGALGAEGPEPYGAGLLLGGPAGFVTGMGLARSRDLSDGQARAITFGGTWGTWQGLGWAEVFDWGEVDFSECGPNTSCEDREGRRRFAAMIAAGLAGAGTGLALSRKNIPAGTASVVNFGALWGTWFGLAGGILADAEDDRLLATTLLGGNGGLIAAALLAPDWDMSVNRSRLISIAGVIGGLGGAGLDLIIQPNDEKVGIGIPLVMSVGGLAVGAWVTRNYDARGRRADGDAGSALLDVRAGHLSVGMPVPSPMLVRAEREGRAGRELAAGITIFRARF